METTITQWVHSATEVLAVRFLGDPDEAKMLMANGWLDGSDIGFGRDQGGENILRGRVGSQVVFPGDVLVFHPDWKLEVWEAKVFFDHYEEPDDLVVITDGMETVLDLSRIPTGENPDAVLLEVPVGQPVFDAPAQGTGMQSSYSGDAPNEPGTTEAEGGGTSGEESRDSVPSETDPGTPPSASPQPVDGTVEEAE